MWEYNHTDELYHYGILGMRWGRHKAKAQERSIDRKYKREYKADKWKSKMDAKDKAKAQHIKDIDSKINKTSVKRYVNTNRAKMAGHAIGATAGTAAAGVVAGIPLYNKYKGPAGRSYLNMMASRGSQLKTAAQKANHWYKPISKAKVRKQMGEYVKDTEMIRKDYKKWATAAAVGATVVTGVAAYKIHKLHKDNKIAKEHDYRKYKNKRIKNDK